MSYPWLKHLGKTGEILKNDKATFEKWRCEAITTAQAIASFRKNNGINRAVEIKSRDFEMWLISLGWWRDE